MMGGVVAGVAPFLREDIWYIEGGGIEGSCRSQSIDRPFSKAVGKKFLFFP